MRKILFIAGLLLFGLSACEGPMGPPGPPGIPGQSVVVRSIQVEVRNSNWQHTWVYEGGYFSAFIPLPELTAQIFDHGAVIVYREWQDNQGVWLAQPLPFTLPTGDGVHLWTEQFDFDFGVGNMMIYFTISDFIYENWQPGRQFFRIVLLR